MDMRVSDFPEELREEHTAVTCWFCWPRLAMTKTYDHHGRPICAGCAKDPHRHQSMPRFLARIKELK